MDRTVRSEKRQQPKPPEVNEEANPLDLNAFRTPERRAYASNVQRKAAGPLPEASSAEQLTREGGEERGASPSERAYDGAGASVQMHGGNGKAAGGSMHDMAEAGTRDGGGALPHREAIQRSFGAEHDLSGIQAHVGGKAAQASEGMNADAYTVGDHVAFRSSPSLHLAAHEAAHVVQQRGGVQLKGGVGESGDQYEQHADQVADAVVQGKSAEGLLAQHAGGGGGQAVQHHKLDVDGGDLDTVKNRAGKDNLEEKDTDKNKATGEQEKGVSVKDGKSMAKNPAFEADAMAFEDKFAAKVWADGRTAATTQLMATNAKAYLMKKYGEWKKENDNLMNVIKTCGGDNPAWSGSVGTSEKHYQALLDVFDKGNIAEQMSHLEAFFINVLGSAALEVDKKGAQKLVEEAGMNVDYFKEKQNAVAGKSKWSMIDVPQDSDVAGQWHARMERFQGKGKKEKEEGERSSRTIEQTGAEMSEREEALHKEKDGSFDKKKDPVMWGEGVKIWIMNEQDKWVFAQRQASLPIGAGPSGTTNKCMQAAKLFGVGDPYLARMACIGYLLPSHHHTLVEILAGASPHGCTYTKGQQMYRNLKPYDESDLKSCGKGDKFPDETAGDGVKGII